MSAHRADFSVIALVPAAGIGSRMQADRPKQYLTIGEKTVLEHTIYRLLEHPQVQQVVVVLTDDDPYFSALPCAADPRIQRVSIARGKERADSVLKGLEFIQAHCHAHWAMVHDAARPCVRLTDIDRLIEQVSCHDVGGILAAPVRDTMKRSTPCAHITQTVERVALWHALTPQLFPVESLTHALRGALASSAVITDEASALEWAGKQPLLVTGSADNIKITQPEDLALAEFYLQRENKDKS
ncbi:2-C-methyl-D-erythritol 4-phosphate cytidylyltransferase [Vibrio sp. AK197]